MKGNKHAGGHNQGYNSRPYQYQNSSDNNRQYREPPFHIPGGPGSGPGMRPMHHHPQQPPTPPQPQDPKGPPAHLQAQSMHLAQHAVQSQQPGSQMIFQGQLIQGRPAAPQNMYNRGSAPVARQPAPRGIVVNQVQNPGAATFIPSGPQVSFNPRMAQPFVIPPYLTGGPSPQFAFVNQYGSQYPGMVYVRPPSVIMPQPAQPGAGGAVMPAPPEPSMGPRKKPRSNAIPIIDPDDGHDVVAVMFKEEDTPPRSGESSARETPQLNTDNRVASEFARKVASTLGDEIVRPGSRSSSYSEAVSEPRSVSEISHGPPGEGVASPNMETDMVVVSGMHPHQEPPLVENNVTYATQEPAVPRWQPVPLPVSIDPNLVPLQPPPMMLLQHPEDVLRHPPHREFQGWPQEPVGVPPHVANMAPTIAIQTGVPPPGVPPTLPAQPTMVKKPEQTTPVVSALSGQEMDNIHSPVGRDYPALGGQRHAVHQSPGRTKRQPRPQRSEPESFEVQQPPPAPAPVEISKVVEQPPQLPVDIPAPVVHPPSEVVLVSQTPTPQVSAPAASPVVEAKSSHHKSKGSKRHNQRQENQRQATPPPRPVTPVAAVVETPPPPAASPPATLAPVPTSTTAPTPTSETTPLPQPEPVEQVTMGPQRTKSPAPVPPKSASPVVIPLVERDPTPPPSAPVTQVVDVVAENIASLKLNESSDVSDEKREELLVAAMNKENDKLTASKKLSDGQAQVKSNSAVSPDPKRIQENNNVPEVTVLVEPTLTEPSPLIETAKPIPVYKYKPDQWSPQNQSGKKQYDRSFILELQNHALSKKKPDNLPILEVVKGSVQREVRIGNHGMPYPHSHPHPHGRNMGDNNIPMPNFMNMNKSSSLRGIGGLRDSNHLKRPSLMGNKGKGPIKPVPIQVSLSLNKEVKLRECEVPWKPSRAGESNNLTEEDKETEALYKKVRGVLNRLTPQKFQKLVTQVRQLPINTEERLKGVTNLVFEKAVDEPGFSTMYAQLCSELAKIQVKSSTKDEMVNYRVLLIKRCQQEFEKSTETEINRDARVQEIKEETDPDKKKELEAQLEEDERNMRVKAVGNVRFIGELYKMKQLTAGIMDNCIQLLLRLNTEESLECLCKLLTTIGRSLEADMQEQRERALASLKSAEREGRKDDANKFRNLCHSMPQNLKKYFDELEKIVKERKTSSRVRFMIQDLIDLREARWVPKRDEGPKTMDQIAKDAEREMNETNLALAGAALDKARGGPVGRQDPRNVMDPRGPRRQDNNSGWQQVQSNPRKQFLEPSKLRVTPVEDLCFGKREQFMWNKGAHKSEERMPPASGFGNSQNKFAVLEEKMSYNPPPSQGVPPPREQIRPVRPTPSDESRFSRNSQTIKPEPNPVPREKPKVVDLPPTETADSSMDPDKLERATKALIDEYVSSKDLEESKRTLEEKFPESERDQLVSKIFLYAFDSKGIVRRCSGEVLAYFLESYKITLDQFISGLKEIMESIDDIAMDVPKVWEYLGEILADPFVGGLAHNAILSVFPGCENSGPLRTIATILKIAEPESAAVTASALEEYLGGAQKYKAFIESHGLSKKLEECKWVFFLLELLDQGASLEVIKRSVEASISPAHTDLCFIRALTNAALSDCLKEECVNGEEERKVIKLHKDRFQKNLELLRCYIENEGPRELECIYTIQAKMVALQHPQGVLLELFTMLFDNDVLSRDSFREWRNSDDPRFMDGRGVCLTSLTSFFNHIEEEDGDDDS